MRHLPLSRKSLTTCGLALIGIVGGLGYSQVRFHDNSKGQGVNSLKAYGVVGDGVTNDQAALAAAITSAGTNGVLEFPCGTYLVGATLSPLSGQTWRSASPMCAGLKKGANVNLITLDGVTDFSLIGMSLDGGYNHGTDTGFTGNCIFASNSAARLKFSGSKFTNCEDGAITMTATSYVTVEGNYFENNGGDGVTGTPVIFGNFTTSHHRVQGNTILMRSGGAHGVAYHTEGATSTIHDVQILDNQILNQGGAYCMEVGSFASGGGVNQRPSQALVSRNLCRQTASGSGGYSFDSVVNSFLLGNSYLITPSGGGITSNAGIECVNCVGVVVSGNNLDLGQTGSIGIAMDHEMSYSLVVDNIIKNVLTTSSGQGITSRADAAKCWFTAVCEIMENTIARNTIIQPSGANSTCIRVQATAEPQIFRNNRVLDNQCIWLGAGGANSTGVGFTGFTGDDGNQILRNVFRELEWGVYAVGMPADGTYSTGNTFQLCTTDVHTE